MGSTSENYKKKSHLKFNAEDAFEHVEEKVQSNFKVIKMHFNKAKTMGENHEIWLVMQNPNLKGADGKPFQFIMCVVVHIDNGTIWWRETSAAEGPLYFKCPKEYLALTNNDLNDYESEWRNKIMSQNLKTKEILVQNRYTITI